MRTWSTPLSRNIKNKRRKGHLLISHLAAWTALARKSCDVANQWHHLVQYVKTSKNINYALIVDTNVILFFYTLEQGLYYKIYVLEL
jgi:hypothetical protein